MIEEDKISLIIIVTMNEIKTKLSAKNSTKEIELNITGWWTHEI